MLSDWSWKLKKLKIRRLKGRKKKKRTKNHNNPYKSICTISNMEDVYNDVSSEVREIDRELAELLKKQSTKIKVVGIGGGGGNSLGRMKEIGIKGGELIAINTDAQDLLYSNADQKILIGKELTQGLGAGSNPRIGEEAAKESESEIKKKLSESDMIFITCGLGGGTGTGGAPVIANIAKKQGALAIGVVTLPFTIEGKKRLENAMNGLERLEAVVDTLIVIPNDKLLELAPELPLYTAFKIADEILTNAVKGITELVTTSGLVNLDFADINAVMADGGVSLIGMGESDSTNRAIESVEKAINNPLLDVDISNASGALVNIIGGPDMSLDECKLIIETVGNKLSPDAKLIWGAQISADMDKSIRVLLIVTGVKSSQIFGHGETLESIKHKEIEEELGIEFFE
jgi:cell division protein FtsZ